MHPLHSIHALSILSILSILSTYLPMYLCIGGAVITDPPLDQNKTEGDMVNFKCQGEGTPGNYQN